MKKLTYILYTLFILSFWSCEDVIEVEVDEGIERISVEGTIDNELGPRIKITRSLQVTVDEYPPGISNAVVTIQEDENQPIQLVESSDSVGLYIAPEELNFVGKPNHNYYLKIVVDDKIITASDFLAPVEPIDSIQVHPSSRGDSIFNAVFTYGKETPGVGNFYKWDIYIAPMQYDSTMFRLLNDTLYVHFDDSIYAPLNDTMMIHYDDTMLIYLNESKVVLYDTTIFLSNEDTAFVLHDIHRFEHHNDAESIIVVSDEWVDGNYVNGFEIFTDFHDPEEEDEAVIPEGAEVYVEQRSISAFAYDYFYQLFNQASTGFLFSVPPANIKSNLTCNTGEEILGIFWASEVSRSETDVAPKPKDP